MPANQQSSPFDKLHGLINDVKTQAAAAPVPSASPQPASDLDGLLAFAKQNGYRVTSSNHGKHNVGSAHYQGRAIDIDHRGVDYNTLLQHAQAAGYTVRDERTHPAGQKEWDGAHFHIQKNTPGHAVSTPQAAAPVNNPTQQPMPFYTDANGILRRAGNQQHLANQIQHAVQAATPKRYEMSAPPVPKTDEHSPFNSLRKMMADVAQQKQAAPVAPAPAPAPTNDWQDLGATTINTGSGGLINLHHGNGWGAKVGSFLGPAIGTGAAILAAPETGGASLAIPATYMGLSSAGNEARRQFNEHGSINNPLAVVTAGGTNAAMGYLGPVGQGLKLIPRVALNAGVNAAAAGGQDLIQQAAEQGSLAPKVDLHRFGQAALIGGGLGAGFAALHGKGKASGNKDQESIFHDQVQADKAAQTAQTALDKYNAGLVKQHKSLPAFDARYAQLANKVKSRAANASEYKEFQALQSKVDHQTILQANAAQAAQTAKDMAKPQKRALLNQPPLEPPVPRPAATPTTPQEVRDLSEAWDKRTRPVGEPIIDPRNAQVDLPGFKTEETPGGIILATRKPRDMATPTIEKVSALQPGRPNLPEEAAPIAPPAKPAKPSAQALEMIQAFNERGRAPARDIIDPRKAPIPEGLGDIKTEETPGGIILATRKPRDMAGAIETVKAPSNQSGRSEVYPEEQLPPAPVKPEGVKLDDVRNVIREMFVFGSNTRDIPARDFLENAGYSPNKLKGNSFRVGGKVGSITLQPGESLGALYKRINKGSLADAVANKLYREGTLDRLDEHVNSLMADHGEHAQDNRVLSEYFRKRQAEEDYLRALEEHESMANAMPEIKAAFSDIDKAATPEELHEATNKALEFYSQKNADPLVEYVMEEKLKRAEERVKQGGQSDVPVLPSRESLTSASENSKTPSTPSESPALIDAQGRKIRDMAEPANKKIVNKIDKNPEKVYTESPTLLGRDGEPYKPAVQAEQMTKGNLGERLQAQESKTRAPKEMAPNVHQDRNNPENVHPATQEKQKSNGPTPPREELPVSSPILRGEKEKPTEAPAVLDKNGRPIGRDMAGPKLLDANGQPLETQKPGAKDMAGPKAVPGPKAVEPSNSPKVDTLHQSINPAKPRTEATVEAAQKAGFEMMGTTEARQFLEKYMPKAVPHFDNLLAAARLNQTVSMRHSPLDQGGRVTNTREVSPVDFVKQKIKGSTEVGHLINQFTKPGQEPNYAAVRDNLTQRLTAAGEKVSAKESYIDGSPLVARRNLNAMANRLPAHELTHVYVMDHNFGTTSRGDSYGFRRLDRIEDTSLTGKEQAIPKENANQNRIKPAYDAMREIASHPETPPSVQKAINDLSKGGKTTRKAYSDMRQYVENHYQQFCKAFGLE